MACSNVEQIENTCEKYAKITGKHSVYLASLKLEKKGLHSFLKTLEAGYYMLNPNVKVKVKMTV